MAMTVKSFAAAIGFCLFAVGCRGSKAVEAVKQAGPPPVTAATFEPVYRAAKSVQGATAAGVTYVTFGELLHGFSTEIDSASDHPLNETEQQLLAMYRQAFDDYQISADLWKKKLEAHQDYWKGEIPVSFDEAENQAALNTLAKYHIPVADRKLYETQFKSVPSDAPQRIWRAADATLAKATALLYGRPSDTPAAR